MPLSIGQIEYANCIPLFRALYSSIQNKDHRFICGVPAILNRMLANGEINLSPSSSIIYGFDPDKYWLLPGLSISATGPVRSVLLFSRLPLEELNGCKIGLTSASETSVALLKIILSKFLGFSNEFYLSSINISEALDVFSAQLLIGDAAMRASQKAYPCYQYDLGELWYRFTGLPFVFALWIVNRASVSGREWEVRDFARILHHAKMRSRNELAEYVTGSGMEWYGTEELLSYWEIISYDFDEPERYGLETFYRYAAETGVIGKVPEICYFPEIEQVTKECRP